MADPNYADVAFLLHCDGSDGSTTFTDNSSSPQTITAVNDAQIDTAQSKWGGASGLFDGTDYLTAPHASVGSGYQDDDFTIEFWVRFASVGSNCILFNKANGTGSTYPFQVWFNSATSKIGFRGLNTSFSLVYNLAESGTSTTGVWYHVACVRDGSTFRMFKDGVAGGTASFSGTLADNTQTVSIGAYNSGTFGLNGWIDDVRYTKNIARYTAGFTPPAGAFPDSDEDTEGRIAVASPLGSPALLGYALSIEGLLSVASPLGAVAALGILYPHYGSVSVASPLDGTAAVLAHSDFTPRLLPRAAIQYTMDLVTPSGLVRVPISSWQATGQTVGSSYAACVVPACGPYLEALGEATEFIVNRRSRLLDGSTIEHQMLRSTLDTLQVDQGPTNHTASLSGYGPEQSNEFPEELSTRTMQGVRSISNYADGLRIRCSIDWLLRPGYTALYSGGGITVSYINWYVTNSGDEYADIGYRTA